MSKVVGITLLKIKVVNPAARQRGELVECIVDSGAIYAVVPGPTLRRLGIRPDRREEFTLADGSHAKRQVGDAILRSAEGAAHHP
jgi:hypothetical protein